MRIVVAEQVAPAVRHDQPGARVAAVRDRRSVADRPVGTGLDPGQAVVAVPRQPPADHHDQAGAGTSVPSTISTVSLAKRLLGAGASPGPRWSMTRSAVDSDTPKSGTR
ncbi:hypothetical protein Snoj_36400 [Streptomyces nojiriensis]|uniref:Uncharacterized protein n=1 Tax=Streptomyces nojiriensis TaxID=66374 RepID=A0ABQ3SP37_9ACTN|nr:hypothetical protein GCM10010205_46770 [Streptomyces nojiriensis]GHI69722.1 hypothetical protein Snoj_36400 [Streptomyces nojiriensis]